MTDTPAPARFVLLGSFQVIHNGIPIVVGGPKRQAVLIALLHPPRETRDSLWVARYVWGDDSQVRTVNDYVWKLNKALEPTGLAILGGRPGYCLEVPKNNVDEFQFRALLTNGRALRETDPHQAIAFLRQALDLWKEDVALRGFDAVPNIQTLGKDLNRLRVEATEELAALEVTHDNPDLAVDRLRAIATNHPGRGGLQATYMHALHATGNTDEATRVFLDARKYAKENGREPDPRLERAHQQILTGRAPMQPRRPSVKPYQLPHAPPNFTGRTTELDTLLSLWPDTDAKASTALVISAVEGMAGIGKTTLAVHIGHALARRFSDGVLFINLHGFTPDIDPTPPDTALDYLLRSLGVPGQQIPLGLNEKVALYRSVLAGRHVLIVLDNAADENQIRPLIPPTPGCLVLVTSRRRLAGLDDATHIHLTPMQPPEAAALFRAIAGDRAAGADQSTIDDIVKLSGYLPLAILITAARLRISQAMTPAHLRTELTNELTEQQSLERLTDGDRAIDATLAVSYRHLTADQQHVFRLLGLHPGTHLDPYAVAALADSSVEVAQRLLDDLERANLIDQPTYHRYTLHDLVRIYAIQVAAATDRETDRRAALARMFDHYACMTTIASGIVYPYDAAPRVGVLRPVTPTPTFNGPTDAKEWLDAESSNLLATAAYAADHGWPSHTSSLSTALARYLHTHTRHSDAGALHNQALAASRRAGDQDGQRRALAALGELDKSMGHYDNAATRYQDALELAHELADQHGQGHALLGLGVVNRAMSSHDRASDYYRRALGLAQEICDRSMESYALAGLGDLELMDGRYDAAVKLYRRSLTIVQELSDHPVERHVLTNLGTAHREMCRYDKAIDYCRAALDLAHKAGDLAAQSYALSALGVIYALAGRDLAQAVGYCRRALDMTRNLRDLYGESCALSGLGLVYLSATDYVQAADCYKQALAITPLGELNGQFEALHGLGEVARVTGDLEAALAHHEGALKVAKELGRSRGCRELDRAHNALKQVRDALSQRG